MTSTRRTFLTALCTLPGLRWLRPAPLLKSGSAIAHEAGHTLCVEPAWLDGRFIVRLKAGKPGPYRLPAGMEVRRVLQQFDAIEAPLQLERPEFLLPLGDICPATERLSLVTMVRGFPESSLHVWPLPAKDTVLAVEFWPEIADTIKLRPPLQIGESKLHWQYRTGKLSLSPRWPF